MTEDQNQTRLSTVLRQTLAGFPSQAREQVAALAEALEPVIAGSGTEADRASALAQAVSLSHRLAGTAASLGYPRLGRQAAALEILLEGLTSRGTVASTDARRQADLLSRRLRAGAAALEVEASALLSDGGARGDAAVPLAPVAWAEGSAPRLMLVGVLEDDPWWTPLGARMAAYGWAVEAVARDTDAVEETLAADAPDLVVIDLDTVPDGMALGRILCGASGRWSGGPWYLAQSEPGAETRGRAASAGCAGVLAKPVAAETLLDHLAAVRAAGAEESPRVLVHDPDPVTAEVIRFVLESAGLRVDPYASPNAVLHALGEGDVDTLLLCERARSGEDRACTDLAMAIRQDPAFDIPGLVLVVPGGDAEPDPVALALAQGGDVVLRGAVDPDLFPATVAGQARRALGRRRRARCEGNGPVLLAESLAAEAARLLGRARSLDLPFAVAWLSATGETVDSVLVRRATQGLGARDLIGRGPHAGLALVMPSRTVEEARAALAPVVAAMPALVPGAVVRLGVAAPAPDESWEALLMRACEAAV